MFKRDKKTPEKDKKAPKIKVDIYIQKESDGIKVLACQYEKKIFGRKVISPNVLTKLYKTLAEATAEAVTTKQKFEELGYPTRIVTF